MLPVADPFFAALWFNSDFNAEGTNTPEVLTAVLTSSPVPEPATLLLFGSGLVGLGVWRRRKRT